MVNNGSPAVDDELQFTLSDPDGVTPVNDADIEWTVQVRDDEMSPWVDRTSPDAISLMETYEVDEDDSGKEIRSTVVYTDRRGTGKTADSTNTSAVADNRAVAPPRFRSGATQTIPEGEAGRNTDQVITATDRDGEVLIFGIQQGMHSDLFELIPLAETTMYTFSGIEYPGYTAQLRAIEALDYEELTNKSFSLMLTLSHGKGDATDDYNDSVDVM